MITVLALVLALALIILSAVSGLRIERLQTLHETDLEASHTACTERIAEVLSRTHERDVLLRAAEAWDSPEDKTNLMRIAREQYRPGGPSVPELWLRDRAAAVFNEREED